MVVSVQHTGTWFLINFLKQHVMVRAVILLEDLYPGENLESIRSVSIDRTVPDRDVVAHMHVTREGTPGLGIRYGAMFRAIGCRDHNVLVPLRDPLRSVITREARVPGRDHSYIVSGFEELIQWQRQIHRMVYWVPIDLPFETQGRKALLDGVLRHCGLPGQLYVDRIARDWEPENVSAGAPEIKEAYQNRDAEFLAARFPVEWDLLKQKEETIRPFLERFGYQDLLWWS